MFEKGDPYLKLSKQSLDFEPLGLDPACCHAIGFLTGQWYLIGLKNAPYSRVWWGCWIAKMLIALMAAFQFYVLENCNIPKIKLISHHWSLTIECWAKQIFVCWFFLKAFSMLGLPRAINPWVNDFNFWPVGFVEFYFIKSDWSCTPLAVTNFNQHRILPL